MKQNMSEESPFFLYAIILPFAHCGIIWLFLIPYSWFTYGKGSDEEYIKEKYKAVWHKLHPWGQRSYNSFAWISFLFGKYDNGNDAKLEDIKRRSRRVAGLVLWTFFLVPVSWIVNFSILALRN
jgi:hypothetical protein